LNLRRVATAYKIPKRGQAHPHWTPEGCTNGRPMTERRRTERIFLQIPISVQGQDRSGNLFAERTTTIEVNRNGARVGLKNSLRVGDEIRVTNLTTGSTGLFRVAVQCPQNYGESSEWGLALSTTMSDLMTDFWGVAFEDLPEAAEPHMSALLVCRVCGRRELVAISAPEYEVLRHELILPRICANCRTATDWDTADLGRPAERSGSAGRNASPLPPVESATEAERRAVEHPSEPGVSAGQEDGRTGASAGSEAALPNASEGELAPVLGEREAAGSASSSVTAPSPDLDDKSSAQTGGPETSAAEGAERRGARRVPIHVPILVLLADGTTEETFTKDVSKTGLSFPTALNISKGDSIEVVVGYGVVAHPTKQRARVARRIPDTLGVKAVVGAQFTGS